MQPIRSTRMPRWDIFSNDFRHEPKQPGVVSGHPDQHPWLKRFYSDGHPNQHPIRSIDGRDSQAWLHLQSSTSIAVERPSFLRGTRGNDNPSQILLLSEGEIPDNATEGAEFTWI